MLYDFLKTCSALARRGEWAALVQFVSCVYLLLFRAEEGVTVEFHVGPVKQKER